MTVLEYVDAAICVLADDSHREIFTRWRQEYTQRHYGPTERICVPQKHTGYPGFEANLRALLFNQLKDRDPHAEWPYASYIVGSSERVDLHLFVDAVEVWIELGMYASDEKAKYERDFEKLTAVVDKSPTSIGILIHFEIFPRGVVLGIFKDLQSRHSEQYIIHLVPFLNTEGPLAYRLSVQARGNKSPTAHRPT